MAKKEACAETLLNDLTKRLSKAKQLREGDILVHFTGDIESEYCLNCSAEGVQLSKERRHGMPLIEVISDAKRIQAILQDERDARMQFLAGGIRVRGDLRYFSDLAMELGILKEPL